MPAIDDIYRSKFLQARDVPKDGLDYPIKNAKAIELRGRDGTINTKVTLYATSTSKLPPFPLNKTNANAVALVVASRDYDDWAGNIIRINRERVEAFGKMVVGLRVQVPPELLEEAESEEEEEPLFEGQAEEVETQPG